MTQLDKAFFKYVKDKLKDANIEGVVAWYVQNLIFHNGDYLKYLTKEYKLPNDIPKLHAKIISLV